MHRDVAGFCLEDAGLAAAKLKREDSRSARALGRLMAAAVDYRSGRDAVAELEEVGRELEALGMKTFSLSARCRLGELIGGSRGRELRDQALGALSAEGALEPDRIVAVHAPEFVRRGS